MLIAELLATTKRGEEKRRKATERRAKALEFYERSEGVRMKDVGIEMGVCEGYAGEMVRRAKVEREYRNLHAVRRIYGEEAQ